MSSNTIRSSYLSTPLNPAVRQVPGVPNSRAHSVRTATELAQRRIQDDLKFK